MLTKIPFAYHAPMSQGFVVRLNIIPRLLMSENISDGFRISSPYSLLRKPFFYMSIRALAGLVLHFIWKN